MNLNIINLATFLIFWSENIYIIDFTQKTVSLKKAFYN